MSPPETRSQPSAGQILAKSGTHPIPGNAISIGDDRRCHINKISHTLRGSFARETYIYISMIS